MERAVAVGMLVNSRYELDDLPVGRGGMGEVWFGHDVKLDRPVAVKFVRFPGGKHDNEYVRRFVRESRITARLEHPGVPAVYDVGTHDGRPYMVMQRIQGISIADLVAEYGPLPIGWAAGIAAQVCAVLTAAHRASLVHRDLKPSNLMLQPDGAVKVLDFGLAVAPTLSDFSKITASGLAPGTPAYMAPEQIETNISGPATDLYALGCTLYEMLTGKPLFTGSTSYEVWSKQVSCQPPPVRTVRDDVPAGLEDLLLHLLRKKPEDRPEGAQVVYARLLPFATDLRPLPGILHLGSSPTRMYGSMLGRVLAAAPTTPAKQPSQPIAARNQPATPSQRRPAQASVSRRSDLRRARAEASRLVESSRYGQAARVLAAAVASAITDFGRTDEEVMRLRLELADALFEEGDYRRAARAYEELGEDVAREQGPDAELALHCRLRGATCRALFGETSEALRQLQALVRDEVEAFGADDPRTLELRHQIGLLELGAGQRHAAEKTLADLRADLIRLYGPTHPSASEIADLLAGLRRQGLR